MIHPSKLHSLLGSGAVALAEGAVIERIRRQDPGLLDSHLLNAPLVYSDPGRTVLAKLHRQYLDIGRHFDLPLLVCTDTWRSSRSRLEWAGLAGRDVNADCVTFMRELIAEYGVYADKVCLAGLLGCKGDAYKPGEALSNHAAAAYHTYQADRLASAGVDLLLAATMPSLPEAAGMAAALSRTGIPYGISFVLDREGLILDGTSLDQAITVINDAVSPAPEFYMANCCHPVYYEAGMTRLLQQAPQLLGRMIGLQANTSTKSAGERDNLAHLDQEDPDRLAESMIRLHRQFGTRILGGCCGTDDRHIAALAARCRRLAREASGQKEFS